MSVAHYYVSYIYCQLAVSVAVLAIYVRGIMASQMPYQSAVCAICQRHPDHVIVYAAGFAVLAVRASSCAVPPVQPRAPTSRRQSLRAVVHVQAVSADGGAASPAGGRNRIGGSKMPKKAKKKEAAAGGAADEDKVVPVAVKGKRAKTQPPDAGAEPVSAPSSKKKKGADDGDSAGAKSKSKAAAKTPAEKIVLPKSDLKSVEPHVGKKLFKVSPVRERARKRKPVCNVSLAR